MIPATLVPAAAWKLIVETVRHPNTNKKIVVQGDHVEVLSTDAGARDSESYCHRCDGPNRPWSAPSPLWNAVMRQTPDVWLWEEIICPTCFMVLAEDAGIAACWRLDADSLVNLPTTSPDGRVWDEAARLWAPPVPAGLEENNDE